MPFRIFIRSFFSFLRENIISFAGLAIGMMVTVFSVTYIVFESSYDRFHSKSDRIYQLSTQMETEPGSIAILDNTHHKLKDFIDNQIPQVEETTRIYVSNQPIIIDLEKYKGHRGLFVDNEFMSIFDFKTINGDVSVLRDPDKIILTRKLALLLFSDIECLGKTLQIEEKLYTVGAVVDDPPGNSRFKFDYLLPIQEALRKFEDHNFVSVLTFILISTEFDDVDHLTDLINRFFIDDYGVKSKERFKISISPLTGFNQFRKKPSRSFMLFISVSILVLLVSIVNFVNSCAAGSELRTREIGIRKVMGASKTGLIRNMIINSVLLSFLAVIAGLILSELFIRVFRDLSGVEVKQYGPGLIWIQVSLLLVSIITGFLAGIFPAVRYSSPDIMSLITGRGKNGKVSINIRKSLVTVQYVISSGLLITLLVFYFQLNYLASKDPGYKSENRILIEVPRDLEFSYSSYINELKNIPGIISISGNGSEFGGTVGFGLKMDRDSEGLFAMGCFVEDSFFRSYGMNLIHGKTFEQTSGRDSARVLVDRSTASLLGLNDPVGEKVILSQREVEIIGVVEDADLIALKDKRAPYFYTQFYDLCCELIIHYSGGDPAGIASAVNKKLREFDPEAEYNYRSVDEARKTLYEDEEKQVIIVFYVGIIALILTITGAFSMANYLSRRNAKQVSIRRVMGASVSDVLQNSLSKMLWMILIGFALASPLAYLISKKWLQGFVLRISITPIPFIIALLILIFLVLITVFFKERKAAMANPVVNLRQE